MSSAEDTGVEKHQLLMGVKCGRGLKCGKGVSLSKLGEE